MITMRFPGGRLKTLTLSYDDGVRQDRRLIPILDKFGIKATFNINYGVFSDDVDYNAAKGRMSLEEAKNLYMGSPHEVAVHGLEHAFETELSPNLMTKEILSDRENLEREFDTIIRGMAYPYGSFNDSLVNTLKCCGIVYSRTCENTLWFDMPTDWLRLAGTCHHSNPDLFELCDKFLEYKPQNVAMFYLWGHSYEFDLDIPNNNWSVIENFAQKMGGHDDIWYATNIEIYDYVKAYESLLFSTDQTIVYNPGIMEVSFAKLDKKTHESVLYTVKGGEKLHLK